MTGFQVITNRGHLGADREQEEDEGTRPQHHDLFVPLPFCVELPIERTNEDGPQQQTEQQHRC